MFHALIIALSLNGTWIELTSGLPPEADASYMAFGKNSDDIWVGTTFGGVWRSQDGGRTYFQVFRALFDEPVVTPRNVYSRRVQLDNFGRDSQSLVNPRDRAGQAKRATDLSGAARDDTRDISTPLLSSVVRTSARERVSITRITHCPGDATYIIAGGQMWRSMDDGWRWDWLSVSPAGADNTVYWVSCDYTTKGRLVANTPSGTLESLDYGESFMLYPTLMGRAQKYSTAAFDETGRLVTLVDRRVRRENEARNGFDQICHLTGQSVDQDNLRWAWLYDGTNLVAVTNDGWIWCRNGVSQPMEAPELARRPARYVYFDRRNKPGQPPDHIYLLTEQHVYESLDGGKHVQEIFRSPSARSVRRILQHRDRPDDLVIITGGQVWRRLMNPDDWVRGGVPITQNQLSQAAPLWEVVQVAIGRAELMPDQLAAKRIKVRLRSLLPSVILQYSHTEGAFSQVRHSQNLGISGLSFYETVDVADDYYAAFAMWNLGDFVFDPMQTSRAWADLERLRQKLTYHIEDNYSLWLRETQAVLNLRITSRERIYHDMRRRRAAAYLDAVTGRAFPAFDPEAAAVTDPLPRSPQ